MQSEEPGYTLHIQSDVVAGFIGAHQAAVIQYERLCAVPCDFERAPGSYRFLIERPGGSTLALRGSRSIPGDGTLDISIESRRRRRIALWITAASLMVVGLPLVGAGVSRSNRYADLYGYDEVYAPGRTMTIIGAAAMGAGAVFTLGAALSRDRGRLVFRPANF